jgi:hypothetical protein
MGFIRNPEFLDGIISSLVMGNISYYRQAKVPEEGEVDK